jgi:hypothetical protein
MTLHYTGTPDLAFFVKELFSRLLTCVVMEYTLFGDFEARLHLDDRLLRMRHDFELFKEQCRRELITRYNMQPPASKP